jgi:hypothetical protein
VSGPLASWVGEHSKASWRGKVVLKEYALAAHHDGSPSVDVSRDDLVRRIGCGVTTVKAGRQEVVELGELVELRQPLGRGNVGSYRVEVVLCPAEVHCWTCALLSHLLEKGRVAAPLGEGKGSPIEGKGSPIRRKGSRGGPTNGTETDHPQGGTSPPGGAGDARSARSRRGARSARSGRHPPDPAAARRELAGRAGSEAEALAVMRLDDGEAVSRWQQSADAPSA